METAATPQSAEARRWTIGTRIAFRFVCSYFVLYCINQPGFMIATYLAQWGSWIMPLYQRLFGWSETLWDGPAIWVAARVFHTTPSMVFSGSGDRLIDWIEIIVLLGFAVVATLVWSVLDRKNRYDERIYPWFRLYIRLTLALIILYYGAAKIFPSQFPPMGLTRYMQPLASGSPMGLLWAAMSASRMYAFFAGLVETLAAALLFVPRFATLGGLVAAGSMTNVLMLNLGFDVPVKQFSFHLLVMALLIVGPDLEGLAGLFLLNRPYRLYTSAPLFTREWLNRTGLAVQLACCLLFVPAALLTTRASAAEFGLNPPYYGLWKVDDFRSQGKLRPPLLTDPVRWREVGFERYHRFLVEPMDGLPRRYTMAMNDKATTLSLRALVALSGSRGYATGPEIGKFAIRLSSPDRMVLDGTMQGQSTNITLERVPFSNFLLVSRGFHWVNEIPYNL